MSDNAAPILSRDALIAKLTAAIGDSRLNFSGMDIAAHDAAQREEIQRLTDERDAADQDRLLRLFDQHAVECGNCGCGLIARGGSLGEHHGLTSNPEGSEDEQICGFCAGAELSALRAELEAATKQRASDKHELDRLRQLSGNLQTELDGVRVRLEEAERECGKEYFFRFPRSTDYCGPYKSIEEMREDSAWNNPAWTPVWRLKGLPPGPCHEFERDAAISQTAEPEENREA